MNLEEQKKALRGQIRMKNLQLSDRDCRELSGRVTGNAYTFLRGESIRVAHCYCSFGKEVDTYGLINSMIRRRVRVFGPVTDFENNEMRSGAIPNLNVLRPSKAKIPEPPVSDDSPEDYDIVFVPGVAFDKRGGRLGRGRGFYDRFLQKTKGLRVGLAFSFQVLEQIPTSEQDENLDVLVTEDLIYRFRNRV